MNLPELTVRTEILSGFNPEVMAEDYIKARAYTRLGQKQAAVVSKTDLNLGLYGQFGLSPSVAQTIAAHEIEAWSGEDDQTKQAEYYAAHSLLAVITSLHYSPEYASQLDFEINDSHLTTAKSRESHNRLLVLMFSFPQFTPQLEQLSSVYFQGRRRAAAAFVLKEDYPKESSQRLLLAKQSFTDYYRRLEALINPARTDSAGGRG